MKGTHADIAERMMHVFEYQPHVFQSYNFLGFQIIEPRLRLHVYNGRCVSVLVEPFDCLNKRKHGMQVDTRHRSSPSIYLSVNNLQ